MSPKNWPLSTSTFFTIQKNLNKYFFPNSPSCVLSKFFVRSILCWVWKYPVIVVCLISQITSSNNEFRQVCVQILLWHVYFALRPQKVTAILCRCQETSHFVYMSLKLVSSSLSLALNNHTEQVNLCICTTRCKEEISLLLWTPCRCQFVYLSHQDSLLKQKSELKSLSLCKKMCCCAYDCPIHTDSNPHVARGRLLA